MEKINIRSKVRSVKLEFVFRASAKATVTSSPRILPAKKSIETNTFFFGKFQKKKKVAKTNQAFMLEMNGRCR
jgi:hypothetical protein